MSAWFDSNQTLSWLISETYEYVLDSEPRRPKSKPLTLTSEVAKPVKVPSWVEEFNKDTKANESAPIKAPLATQKDAPTSDVDGPTEEEQRAAEKTVAELEARKAARLAADRRKSTWSWFGLRRKTS